MVVPKHTDWKGCWGWSERPIKGFQQRDHLIARGDIFWRLEEQRKVWKREVILKQQELFYQEAQDGTETSNNCQRTHKTERETRIPWWKSGLATLERSCLQLRGNWIALKGRLKTFVLHNWITTYFSFSTFFFLAESSVLISGIHTHTSIPRVCLR